MRPARPLTLAAVALFALTACGTQNTDASAKAPSSPAASTSAPAESAPSASPSNSAPAEVPKKLRFTVKTVDGKPFEGSTLAGKDAVLWFWAPWCGECRREAPHVAAVQDATKDKAVFVGVAGLGQTPDMRAFVKDYKVTAFEHVADLDGTVWKRFGVTQQPAYAFVDDSGKVEVIRGELGEKALADKVAELTGN
ncbi:redoxin domain-containing protein [Streptomyces sp. ISL-1]|uniref:redoxin domain-containing protein n=1 Tax=Streptomyces sp. ISL-1 TaxID=2817657 RepID=UPI001BE94AF1|nr:redoxin domain-containing protein [Streptomyces sp. ISL-1]MBT2390729.1 redoxin domain-containing protein [Streptomyces sp. ISL-1]